MSAGGPINAGLNQLIAVGFIVGLFRLYWINNLSGDKR